MYKYEVSIRCGDSGALGTFTCDEPTVEGARKLLLKGKWVEFDSLSGDGRWKIKQSKIWLVMIEPCK